MKKILVIEDEAIARRLFLECLKAEGFDTIGAENGFVGIRRAREHLPDLVICDVVMPQVDGYDVLQALRQNPMTAIIPFIFLSARVYQKDIRKGMEMGADDYLTKPCTVEELLKAIAVRLEKQAALQQWFATKLQPVPEPASVNNANLSEPQSIFPAIPQLTEVFNFIEANYHRSITLSDVAQAVGYSRAYLTTLVASQTGQTVNRWIVERRMVAARLLLQQSERPVEQIATAVGYQNACYFFRQFRQQHGLTPQAWRKKYQSQQFAARQHRNNL